MGATLSLALLTTVYTHSKGITMTYNAKVVFFTVAGIEIQIIVMNKYYSLFLEALLKKVFKTIRVIDFNLDKSITVKRYLTGKATITSIWYKKLSGTRTILIAKAIIDKKTVTLIHNHNFSAHGAYVMVDKITKSGEINLDNWS